MPDNLEIIRLNKDEEFEYFVKYKKTFSKWSLEEHNIFTKASLEYDITKPEHLNEVLKVINQYNHNINGHQRTLEELNIHIKIYQNYLNKQQSLRTPLNSNSFNITNSTSLNNNSLGSIGISSSGITNNSLSLLNNIHSVVTSSDLNNDLYLNNILTNNYFSIINSLDNNYNGGGGGINSNQLTSIKDVSLNNPLLQQQQIKLASKPISPSQSPTLKSNIPTTITPPAINNNNNNNNKINTTSTNINTNTTSNTNNNENIDNNTITTELNKKDLKILKEPWTADDQKKLEEALIKYPSSRFSSVSRWQMIGKEIGITPKAAALRYNQMLNNLVPKKPAPIASPPSPPSSNNEKDSSLGKRTRRTSATKESPLKKEKLDINETISPSKTNNNTTIPPNYYEVEELISKNNLLLETMKSNIMKNENPSISNLNEIIDNINNSIKLTEKWKGNNPMPPLPLKVNDMIVKILSPTTKTATPSSTTNPLNPFNLLNQKKITPTTNLSKKGLSKNAEEWNLVYDENEK